MGISAEANSHLRTFDQANVYSLTFHRDWTAGQDVCRNGLLAGVKTHQTVSCRGAEASNSDAHANLESTLIHHANHNHITSTKKPH